MLLKCSTSNLCSNRHNRLTHLLFTLFPSPQQNHFESESDTESSLSTVVERFSRTGTANSSLNSSFSEKNCLIGQQLLAGAVHDQNRDLQLVNNIERVLNSFEFLEQELDRSEPGPSSGDQLSGGTRSDQRKAPPSKCLLDNLITTSTAPSLTSHLTNPTGAVSSATIGSATSSVSSCSRSEQAGQTQSKNTNPHAGSTVNKSSTGETKNTLLANCPPRDLTF